MRLTLLAGNFTADKNYLGGSTRARGVRAAAVGGCGRKNFPRARGHGRWEVAGAKTSLSAKTCSRTGGGPGSSAGAVERENVLRHRRRAQETSSGGRETSVGESGQSVMIFLGVDLNTGSVIVFNQQSLIFSVRTNRNS